MKPVKQIFEHAAAKITLVFLGLFLAVQNWAAAQGFEVDVNTGGDNSGGAWYTSWWVWAAAALFVLALVAIVSAGRRHS